ncbi:MULTISPECIES: hypothetical protein [Flavobacterium]|uniref:hypothetical protein n=1 Tax=Flavobacterium TaxID=237 RepID=UPI001FCC62FF|nr:MULTISPECIES: hypothetical protein [Flavobacterium]UOK42227.1 hypothetical protein LZF87_13020 [Flavobacterium enshiense]
MIENIDFILQTIRIVFFVTFGMYSIIYIILSIFIKNSIIDIIDKTSNKLISFIGIVFLISWISLIITNFINISEPERDEILDRMFGKYWFGFWIQPLLWIMISQLLRFEKIRKLKFLRLFFSILFFATIEQLIIIFISSHRDFTNPFIHFTTMEIVTGITIKIFLFLISAGIYYIVERKVKVIKSKKNHKSYS